GDPRPRPLPPDRGNQFRRPEPDPRSLRRINRGPEGEGLQRPLQRLWRNHAHHVSTGGQRSPGVSGRLTTHVLDTVNGQPAGALRIELWRIERGDDDERRTLIRTQITNNDGRTDEPMLAGDEMT